MSEARVEIKKVDIQLEDGNCWIAFVPDFVSGDGESDEYRSTLRLLEDGRPLGPAHTLHKTIREAGEGRYSHWGTVLYFSTSDGSDPRTSAHRYEVIGPARTTYTDVPRGYNVVPSFVAGSVLDTALFTEMETHPEADGKSSWGTRNILHSFILSLRPRTVLEIGAHIGSASVVMGAALRANKFGKLFCLEPQEHYFRLLSEFIRKAELTSFVQPLQILSTSKELRDIVRDPVEMIYLDANHSYSASLADLRLCDQLLAQNGFIFLDDVGPEQSPRMDPEGRGGVRQALLDFAKDRLDLQVIFMEPPLWLNPCGLGIVCKQNVGSITS